MWWKQAVLERVYTVYVSLGVLYRRFEQRCARFELWDQGVLDTQSREPARSNAETLQGRIERASDS